MASSSYSVASWWIVLVVQRDKAGRRRLVVVGQNRIRSTAVWKGSWTGCLRST